MKHLARPQGGALCGIDSRPNVGPVDTSATDKLAPSTCGRCRDKWRPPDPHAGLRAWFAGPFNESAALVAGKAP